ncbi:oligosaccharide flippase family protein [Paludicola sp. MB14-C6]|uniref:lipopolysaccharide biosynthesis protein n=1 Tax=Paludihabitans sp. MB14-C6 TaxID=3070656 RepID=UPI0027DAC640|nr:oligosaccharide flippase family protein [Paludicola sp. MB14-C6]WMJ22587.1 oligosaccharide flippase family protein [Paludicola sp. MB14-C6]
MKLLSRFKKSEYAKNSAILMTGTVLSQVLKALTQVVLALFLGDVVLGDYGKYLAWYSILIGVFTGRYELAIMLPKDDNDGFMITMLSSGLSVILASVMGVVLMVLQFGFQVDVGWIRFLPITLAILGVYFSINYWLNRKKKYKRLAINRTIQGFLVALFSAFFYWFKPTRQDSMIWGYIASQAIVLVILLVYAINDYKSYQIKIDFKRMKELALEHINFPKFSVISSVVNNLTMKLPILLLGFFENTSIVGQYTMMESILAAPIALVSEAVRDVFRQKASRDYVDDHECYQTYKVTFKTLALAAIIPFILIMFGGKPVLDIIYKKEFAMAGYFIMIMAPFFYIRFVAAPLTFMTFIAGKQAFDMKWQIAFCISSSVAFLLGFALTHNPYIMVLLYGISNGVMYTISLLYTRKLAKGQT